MGTDEAPKITSDKLGPLYRLYPSSVTAHDGGLLFGGEATALLRGLAGAWELLILRRVESDFNWSRTDERGRCGHDRLLSYADLASVNPRSKLRLFAEPTVWAGQSMDVMLRLAAISLVLPITLLVSLPALAGSLRPEDAQAKREQVDTSDLAAVERVAEQLGDPELFLQASALLRTQADASRDLELAKQALPLARRAQDIALYLSDEAKYKATDWQPVTQDRARVLAKEADQAIMAIGELVTAIKQDQRVAEERAEQDAAEAEEARDKQFKVGTRLVAGGSVALAMGAGGIVMLSAGLAKGAGFQREAESLDTVLELDRLRELDRMGAQANTIAYVGCVLGGVGLGAGVALIIVGARKRAKAGPSNTARVNVSGYLNAQDGGLQLSGRF